MDLLRSSPTTASRASDRALLRRFWAYAAPDARWLAIGLLAVPLMSLAGLAQPLLVKEAIDGPIADAVAGRPDAGDSALLRLAGLFFVALLGEYVFRGTQLFALQRLGYRTLQRLRRAIYDHVLRQGSGFFDKRATGSLLTRTTNDVEALGEVLTFGIVGIVGDVMNVVAILGAMLMLDARLTALSLLAAPVIVVIVNFFRRRLRRYSTDIRKANARAAGFFSEALAGQHLVRLHGREAQTHREYRALNRDYLRAYHTSNWYDAALYAVMDGVAALSIALLIWFGTGRFLDGLVSLGLLVAFIQYIQRLFVPIRELSGKFATIERAMAALERIVELLSEREGPSGGEHRPEGIRGAIAFDGLTFRYHPDAEPALRDVSLQIDAGEVVALVGPTGSGKSTLAKLLTRLYAAPAGQIKLDDVPLERWDLEALRGAVGVVQQDVMLFSGTIADNVALYRQGVSEETIEHALRDAQLLDRVEALGGLGARLSERGGNLSVGERQLLSIARVLAYDPPVVILDEATANIDSATEQRLQAAMDRVFEGRTVVVVAHRLATIRKADRIVCLQHGRLVEQGTHDTLLAAGGLYAELIEAARRQSATSDTSADGEADASLADGGERPAHRIDTAPHQGATRTERDQHE